MVRVSPWDVEVKQRIPGVNAQKRSMFSRPTKLNKRIVKFLRIRFPKPGILNLDNYLIKNSNNFMQVLTAFVEWLTDSQETNWIDTNEELKL